MNNQIPVELYKDGWTMQGTYKYLLGPLWVFVNLFKLCLSLSLPFSSVLLSISIGNCQERPPQELEVHLRKDAGAERRSGWTLKKASVFR